MNSHDDERLKCWQQGLTGKLPDRRQLEQELYREVEGAVLRFRATALSRDLAFDHDVRQLTHDLMMALLEPLRRGQFETLAHLHYWLRQAVHRRELNLWRSQRTFKARTFQVAAEVKLSPGAAGERSTASAEDLVGSHSQPDALVEGALYVERFGTEVRKLTTPEEWQIWHLHVECGLEPAEIDRQLLKTPGTASTRLSQLRSGKLRALLEKLRRGEDIP